MRKGWECGTDDQYVIYAKLKYGIENSANRLR